MSIPYLLRATLLCPVLVVTCGCGTHLTDGGVDYSNSQSASNNQPATTTLATVVIAGSTGRVIPSGYLGLSHEWGVAQDLAGSSSQGRNLPYRRLIQNLMQATSEPMIIRIGGNSTDTTVKLRPSDIEPLNELSADLDDRIRFTLGINMAANDPVIATNEVEIISALMPAPLLIGLELGNEPDSYSAKGLRPVGYSISDYVSQALTWNKIVEETSASGTHPVAPALATYAWVAQYIDTVLSSQSAPPDLVTQHFYAGAYIPNEPKAVDFLLANKNATSGPDKIRSYVSAAHHSGKKLRIGELNSLANGGQPGVSDAFASALWGVDIMFEFANVGADGVNWHTGNGGGYGLFEFSKEINASTKQALYTLEQVRPLYYGLQMFSEATASSGRLLSITLDTQANLKVWALEGTDGVVRVAILNKDESKTGSVKLVLPGYKAGIIARLLAPSLDSTTHVTWKGQTYDGSLDGSMQGQLLTQPVQANGDTFTFPMPVVSAALVTLSK